MSRSLQNPFGRRGVSSYHRASAMYDPNFMQASQKKNVQESQKNNSTRRKGIINRIMNAIQNRRLRREILLLLLPIFKDIINENEKYRNIDPKKVALEYLRVRENSDVCTTNENYRECLENNIIEFLDNKVGTLGGRRKKTKRKLRHQ
jgi:hypothetical protein